MDRFPGNLRIDFSGFDELLSMTDWLINENLDMTSITDAQRDMRDAYFGGATGAVCSATAWLTAAIAVTMTGPMAGVWTLVIGGMLIFPASVLLSKALGRSGRHSEGNPLAPLAIEGTIWMVMSILIAIGVALFRVELFFPAMLLIIGGRYLTFVTLYGLRIYWMFGATLALAAILLAVFGAPAVSGAFSGALIEYVFGFVVFGATRRRAH